MVNSISLEVITPSKLFYIGDVEMVIVRTLNGDEGFMANHTWACKLLDTGELWIREAGSKEFKVAAVSGGFIDVKDTITIFTDAAEWPTDIDVARSMSEKERAEEWLKTHTIKDSDEQDIMRAKVAIVKAINRMHVAKGGTTFKNR